MARCREPLSFTSLSQSFRNSCTFTSRPALTRMTGLLRATARAADPEWSSHKSVTPFAWPNADGRDLSLIPAPNGGTEFLFLYELSEGRMALAARDGIRIECRFDREVFPCCWYFASHGAMDGAVTGVLEPCTTMPLSVNEAITQGFCSRLPAGATLATTVEWSVTAGPYKSTQGPIL